MVLHGGAAYLYRVEQNGSVSLLEKIVANDIAANDWFGRDVSQYGNFTFVGASSSDPGGVHDAGAAIFIDWNRMTALAFLGKVFAYDGTPTSYFGTSVSQFGDTLAVGARNAHANGVLDTEPFTSIKLRIMVPSPSYQR